MNKPQGNSDKPKIRVKKSFDEIDKSNFRKESFKVISDYFEQSIKDINLHENLKGIFDPISNKAFCCTIVNKNYQHGNASITVRSGGGGYTSMGDIYYSFQENAPENTANGIFRIISDEYNLFLNVSMSNQNIIDKNMTAHEVAKIIWTEFAGQAGISMDG